jgi:uncharacterized protein (TIGR03067 family)
MNVVLLLALAVGAPVEVGKDGKDEKARKEALDKFQGVWKATTVDLSGRPVKVEGFGGADRYTLVVSGDRYVLTTHAGTLQFDPANKAVDLVITDGRYKGTTVPGLFELSDTTLRLAFRPPSTKGAGERPTEIKPGAASGHAVITFEKDAKATKDDAAAKLKDLTGALPRAAAGPAGFGGRVAPDQATQDLLRKVMDKLDGIEKRLDAIEKRLPPGDKK